MVCCLLCFSGDPIEGDPRVTYGNQWQTSMMDAPCKDPCFFCVSGFMCHCCSQYYLRNKALDGDMSRYMCCQGYMNNPCFTGGNCGENSCPEVCLCIESVLCFSCAVSSTRAYVMDTRNISPDPCDNRIIRFNNCIQLLSCVFDIVGIFIKEARHIAHILHHIAELVFYCTVGCMSAQTNFELNHKPAQMVVMWENQLPYSAPTAKNMQRYPNISAPETQPGQYQQQQQQQGQQQQYQEPPMAQVVHSNTINTPLVAAAAPQMVMITVPQGLQPGQALQVRHPTTGQLVLVQVPAGLQAGQQFTAQF